MKQERLREFFRYITKRRKAQPEMGLQEIKVKRDEKKQKNREKLASAIKGATFFEGCREGVTD
jgi:thermostable 8-oxoguanine DNA glycosylase